MAAGLDNNLSLAWTRLFPRPAVPDSVAPLQRTLDEILGDLTAAEEDEDRYDGAPADDVPAAEETSDDAFRQMTHRQTIAPADADDEDQMPVADVSGN